MDQKVNGELPCTIMPLIAVFFFLSLLCLLKKCLISSRQKFTAGINFGLLSFVILLGLCVDKWVNRHETANFLLFMVLEGEPIKTASYLVRLNNIFKHKLWSV